MLTASMLAFSTRTMAHAAPAGECLVCYEDVTPDNYCEYRVAPDRPWQPSKYCWECLERLMDSKFEAYVSGVANSTCEAEMRRYLTKGPPIYVEDNAGLPVGEGEHVDEIWVSSDDSVRSGKVKGALEGEARQKLWDEQKAFMEVKKEEWPDK